MLGNILSFLGGVGDFASYISEYFKKNDIRDTQHKIDELTTALDNAIGNLSEMKKKCEQEKLLLISEYEQRIDAVTAEIEAFTPRVGGREIDG